MDKLQVDPKKGFRVLSQPKRSEGGPDNARRKDSLSKTVYGAFHRNFFHLLQTIKNAYENIA
jgi:hypothetical protein